MDGHSWTSVVACDVDTGQGDEHARHVGSGRKGDGVVAWDIEGDETVDFVNYGVPGATSCVPW
ncbi:hypothetical protein [Streptomyces sp. NPDC048295]|uniref:hypothetical protein n=1 Tax=Streptomyces sp. NPDC048295 TaxID=3154617 RepID=UPI003419ECFC